MSQASFVAKPEQNIPESRKDDAWYKKNVYYALSYYDNYVNIKQRSIITRNWEVYTGNINQSEFNHLLYPEGLSDPTLTVPVVFKNYQLAQPLIQQKIGEFLSQKFSFSVDIVNREAVLKKQEKKAAIMAEKIAKSAFDRVSRETGIEITPEQEYEALPDDLRKLSDLSIRENLEDVVLNGLHYLNNQYDIKEVVRKGMEQYLLSNSIILQAIRAGNDPMPKNLNALDVCVFMNRDDDNIRWGDGYVTAQWKSIPETIEQYEVTNEQEEKLRKLIQVSDLNQFFMSFGAKTTWYNGYDLSYFYRNIGQENAKVLIVEYTWRSITQMYVKKSKNKYDEENPYFKKISAEAYKKLSKSEKSEYEAYPYNDILKCTMAGHDMIIKKGRMENQFRREDLGYNRVPLDICGIQKNAMQAMMTILAPLQIEYSIGWFHIERLLGQAGGKAVELWLHTKPDGWSNEKWLFHLKNKGIIIKQYREEDGYMPQQSVGQAVDLGMSSSMQYLIEYVTLIENTAYKLVGTNPATQGILKGNEAVGVTQANLVQSSTISQGIFYDVRRAVEMLLNDMADKLKQYWKDGDVKVWLNEGELVPLKVTDDLRNYDYGVFLKNDNTDEMKMQKLEALASQALASGGADYMDFVMEMMDAENSAEAKAIIKKGMAEVRKMNQAVQQQQSAIQQQMADNAKEANRLKEMEIQVKASTPVAVAQIQTKGKVDTEQMRILHDENVEEVSQSHEKDIKAMELAKQKKGE